MMNGFAATHHLRTSKWHKWAYLVILLCAVAGLFIGWKVFWFLTDDAFIAFRYVSNSQLGYGYTWNPPPFRAVEGYTSFLWVVLLDLIWRLTGLEPPSTANTLSLLFAYGTTFLGILMLWKLELKPPLQRIRPWLLLLVLIGVLTNRTYLAWTSSGLETAMFNFFFTAWIFCSLFIQPGTPRWLAGMSLAAALTTLTRPDGLLLVAATLFLAALTTIAEYKQGHLNYRHFVALTPFLITVAHFIWRKVQYGEWLPNTFAAKQVAPWPESGARYLLSFTIEYALWFWLILVAAFLLNRVWRLRTRQRSPLRFSLAPTRPIVALVVLGTLLAHVAYYTIIIGGDYFEYRVYSYLIWPIFISAVWLLNALNVSPRGALLYLTVFVIAALPIQWVHWAATHDLTERNATYSLKVPIAAYFPEPVRPYVDLFDRLQYWLIEHRVGTRHQEQKIFYEYETGTYPPRSMGNLVSPEDHPVAVLGAVGVPGWNLPTVSIIDAYGLNDRVVAHNPVDLSRSRLMAHEHYLPVGYAECFKPNVKVVAGNKIVVAQRTLTDDEVRHCENQDWPPSEDDKDVVSTAGIDHIAAAPVDDYLWNVWPRDLLYLIFTPKDQDSTQQNLALVNAFRDYRGLGCVVLPSPEQASGPNGYVLAFLSPQDRPPLAELTNLFPWARIVRPTDQAQPYNLGYTALARGAIQPRPDYPRPIDWEHSLSFIGYDLPRTSYQPGETIDVTLYYRVRSSLPPEGSFFVHLIGTAYNPATRGPLWAQDDGNPCRDLFPTDRWQPGAWIIGKMRLHLPLDTPAGDYTLQTGFYNWQTGQPFGILGATNNPPGGLDLVHIQIDRAAN